MKIEVNESDLKPETKCTCGYCSLGKFLSNKFNSCVSITENGTEICLDEGWYTDSYINANHSLPAFPFFLEFIRK